MGLFDKDIVEKSTINAEAIRERIQNKPPALSHHPLAEELDAVIESVLESIYYSVNTDSENKTSWEFPVELFGMRSQKWTEEEERLLPVLQRVSEDNDRISTYVSHRLESLGFNCFVGASTISISLPFDDWMLNTTFGRVFSKAAASGLAPWAPLVQPTDKIMYIKDNYGSI